jgi:hypothetical protein
MQSLMQKFDALSAVNVREWWKADWRLSGTRVAIADIGQLPAFPKRIELLGIAADRSLT